MDSAIAIFVIISAYYSPSMGEQSSSRISGGRFAKKGEFPFTVELSYRPNSVACGGTILSEWHVLTACHCVVIVKNRFTSPSLEIRDSRNARIIAGSLSRNVPEEQGYQVRNVYYWRHHPDCVYLKNHELISDTAMIKLTQPFVLNFLVQPVDFPRDITVWRNLVNKMQMKHMRCTAVGWGLTVGVMGRVMSKGEEHSKYLKALHVNLADAWSCFEFVCDFSQPCMQRMFDQFLDGAQDRLCADGRLTLNGTVCWGDSGSPLICDGVLAGVVSYGVCSGLDIATVYARADTAHSFIFEHLTRSSCDHHTSELFLIRPALPYWTLLLLMKVRLSDPP